MPGEHWYLFVDTAITSIRWIVIGLETKRETVIGVQLRVLEPLQISGILFH